MNSVPTNTVMFRGVPGNSGNIGELAGTEQKGAYRTSAIPPVFLCTHRAHYAPVI